MNGFNPLSFVPSWRCSGSQCWARARGDIDRFRFLYGHHLQSLLVKSRIIIDPYLLEDLRVRRRWVGFDRSELGLMDLVVMRRIHLLYHEG